MQGISSYHKEYLLLSETAQLTTTDQLLDKLRTCLLVLIFLMCVFVVGVVVYYCLVGIFVCLFVWLVVTCVQILD